MDRSTVKQARQGDSDAFARLITERKEDIYRIAYCYVKNEAAALDIVSEAVYKAFVSLRSLQQPQYFNTWLTRIVINTAINYRKRARKLVPLDENIRPEGESEALDRDTVFDLYTAIDTLDDKHKTVIILKYLLGYTLTECAAVLHWPPGTVKTYLHRALQQLKRGLEEDWE